MGAQISKKTKSVHCPVCNVSSPHDFAERERPSAQSCLIRGVLISDFAWDLLAVDDVLRGRREVNGSQIGTATLAGKS